MGLAHEFSNFTSISEHWYSPLAEGGFRLEQPQGLFPRLELAEEPT
jgi:methionyl-tRNA synthetase